MVLPQKIEVSHRTIVFTVLFLIFVWFLYFIRDILLLFFVAVLIMTVLNPFVTRLEKLKIPRAVSVILAYLIVIGLVVISIVGIAPPLIDQSTRFVNDVPKFIERVGTSSTIGQGVFGEVVAQIGRLPSQAAKVGVSVFSNIVAVFTTLIFAFYLLLVRDRLDDQLGTFFGTRIQKEFVRVVDLLEEKLGGWLRGQVALMALVGVTTYIGLLILGIPFALPLAILAGLLEIVPYIGPLISAIPAVIIGFGLSSVMGLAVAALYFVIQQVENYLFVPKVMEKSAGVSPIVTLLALAIGFKIAGIAGVVISVPVVITLQVLLDEYVLSK